MPFPLGTTHKPNRAIEQTSWAVPTGHTLVESTLFPRHFNQCEIDVELTSVPSLVVSQEILKSHSQSAKFQTSDRELLLTHAQTHTNAGTHSCAHTHTHTHKHSDCELLCFTQHIIFTELTASHQQALGF